MYSPERTNWWVERTKLKGHQEAYDHIADSIGGGKIILDIGCGTGEVLARAYKANNGRTYVGTDATEEMIAIAKDNFEMGGIPFEVRDSLRYSGLERKTYLIKDDIAKSRIPDEFSDLTIYSFAETFSDNPSKKENDKMRLAFFREFWGMLLPDDPLVGKLVCLRRVVKKTKVGGRVIITEYDVRTTEKREEETMQDYGRISRFSGLKLTSGRFFESEEVWDDTGGVLRGGETPGYRIFKTRREK